MPFILECQIWKRKNALYMMGSACAFSAQPTPFPMMAHPLAMSRRFRSAPNSGRDHRVASFLWALLVLVWCVGCSAPTGPRETATVPVYFATTRAIVENAPSPDASGGRVSVFDRDLRYVLASRNRVVEPVCFAID